MKPPIVIGVRNESCLLQCLDSLVAVVVARISENGQLLQANRGCGRLLNIPDDKLLPGLDVRNFFIQPTFAQLLAASVKAECPIYEGIINVGDINTACRSLIGVVHRTGNQLLIVGEYDVAEMEMLNAQVIELNEQLTVTQRELARSHRKLQESETSLRTQSLKDPLTGLANRRCLMDFLQNSMERYKRYQEPFSVIMIDIDFFKQVNDDFGHDVGDEVLLAFSALTQSVIRNVDLVARLGGEEFIIVLPQTSLEGAMTKAEQLRAAIGKFDFGSIQRGITASFGVAEYQSSDNVSILLKQVDMAMYASKNGGRNRVTAYCATEDG